MESGLFEIGSNGLQRVDTTQHTELKEGLVLHWGGNMGFPACDCVIVSKRISEYGTHYKVVNLENLTIHQVENYNIKVVGDSKLWHSQHWFLTDRTLSQEETETINTQATRLKEEETKKQEERAKREEVLKKLPLKVGDLFYTGWGYDQTQHDFIIVLDINPSGKTCTCQRVKAQRMERDNMTKRPIGEGFGDTFRLKIEKYNEEVVLRGSYPFCSDGLMSSKRLDTFDRVMPERWFTDTED